MCTVIILYYRYPFEDEPQIICACDSQEAVEHKINELQYMFPQAYPDKHRFETTTVEHCSTPVTN